MKTNLTEQRITRLRIEEYLEEVESAERTAALTDCEDVRENFLFVAERARRNVQMLREQLRRLQEACP